MKYLWLALFLIINTVSLAQNIFDSPYSIYGLGILNNRLSTLNRGMGGTGIAVRDGFNLNYVNPASYGSIVSPISSVFEMGFYVENNRYQTSELSESKTDGSLTNINYWFKFSPRWSSTVGISPFSSVSYKINTQRNLGGISNVNYMYEGSGTISQLYWGNAFNVVKNLSVGVNISYLFGSISKIESIESGALTFENKVNTNKLNVDVGLQYIFNLGKNRSFVIGVVADDGVTFKASQKNYLYDNNSDTLNTTTGTKLNYSVPASMGVGLALQTRRSIVATDLKFENWSAESYSDQEVTFHDTWKFSAGYMYKGNPESTNYLGSVSLRTGFYVQHYYLEVKKNILPQWGITMGVSLPVLDNRSSINLTYSFDRLGTLNDGLILQSSQKIMFDVIIRDLWGIRRKFD